MVNVRLANNLTPSRAIFFPSDTLIYGISRGGSKNFNIRTCEHVILGQLRIGARPATYAALLGAIGLKVAKMHLSSKL